MAAYLEAVDAPDDETARRLLERHAAALAAHVDALGAKEYWRRYGSLELVVLFLPSESLLSSALEVRPDLLQHAFDRDVVLATPTTLLALLRAIAHTWRQDSAARNVAQVHELARELHGRISVLGGHLGRLAAALESAVTAYNQTVGSLESRVLVTARRLADLGVVDPGSDGEAGLPEPRVVTTATRPLSAVELLEGVDGGAPEQAAAARAAGGGPDDHPGAAVASDITLEPAAPTGGGGASVPYGWSS
jgi:DNA recombination protein RmuC